MRNKHLYKDEESLIAAAMQGDNTGLSELYQRFFPKVVNRCFSFVKDQATAYDLAQDVLIKAMEKLPCFHEKAAFSTWLYAITTNHCLEYLRKENLRQTLSLEVGLQLSDDEQEGALQHHMAAMENKLAIFLNQLSPEDRSLIIAKYCQDKTIQELQQSHQLSASAVKMRLKRAKEKLIQLFHQARKD